jgi:CTP synthase
MKYIIVTGGVVSGLGKGVTISSMGRLLQSCGLRVTAIKIDPYLNVDAGTMSPFEHGEVFVLDDGGESDLDLGNYERFLNIDLTSDHNITTGKIYRNVILAERKGDYLGKTVQVVPHITDCIQDWIERVAHIPVDKCHDNNNNDDAFDDETASTGKPADVCLIEVGGTVGDIESSVFLEALRQFQFRVGPENFCLCFVSLIPILSDEQKTKPTQHGVRDVRSLGLNPTVIFCRSTQCLLDSTKQKISSFCHVKVSNILSVHDVSNVYHVPGLLESQGLHTIIGTELKLDRILTPEMSKWTTMAKSVDVANDTVTIALIGKYTGLQDSYLSVIKALWHACMECNVRLNLEWIEASLLEPIANETEVTKRNSSTESIDNNTAQEQYDDAWSRLKNASGVVIPGGFGTRGWEGKIAAASWCRINKKPVLGICLGFQAIVVEYARAILGRVDADSTEFNETTTNPTIIFMPEIDKETMGGTMRLGSRGTKFTHPCGDNQISTCKLLYGSHDIIHERHRHRYEVNPTVVSTIHDAGLYFVGRDSDTCERMEVTELPLVEHPYYVGCQFHPEFKSRPLKPSPPFHGLILASIGQLTTYLQKQKNN